MVLNLVTFIIVCMVLVRRDFARFVPTEWVWSVLAGHLFAVVPSISNLFHPRREGVRRATHQYRHACASRGAHETKTAVMTTAAGLPSCLREPPDPPRLRCTCIACIATLSIEMLLGNFAEYFAFVQARHLILERLRSQAEENVAAIAALESAIRESLSAQERAFACLRPTNGTVATDASTVGVPMDVVEEGCAEGSWQARGGMDGDAGAARASEREAFAGNGVGWMEDEHFLGTGSSR